MRLDADAFNEAAQVMSQVHCDLPNAPVKNRVDNNGVQAYLLDDDTLVIHGSNEFTDWFEFNFDAINLSRRETRGIGIRTGDSGKFDWHAGSPEHAQTVFAFANALRPRRIIGHSLGAASAQIVGAFLMVPTIAFASPRPLRHPEQPAGARFVLNLCRTDDSITHVPPRWWGFRHVGEVIWMNPTGINVGEDHRIDEYIALINAEHVRTHLAGELPDAVQV